MATYTGELKRLGNSHTQGGFKVYSLIEIGDKIITKATINNNLDNYLQDGLSTNEPITIETINNSLTAKGIASLKIGEGKKYVARPFALSFVTLPFIGLAVTIFMSFGFNFWLTIALAALTAWVLQPVLEYFFIDKRNAIVV